MLAAAALAVLLGADAPTSVPSSSPVAEIITAAAAGIAAIIAATAGVVRMRRNREAADAAPVAETDPEDRPARLRERIAALEAEVRNLKSQLIDVAEQLQLRRAADVIAEASAAPRRRRSRED